MTETWTEDDDRCERAARLLAESDPGVAMPYIARALDQIAATEAVNAEADAAVAEARTHHRRRAAVVRAVADLWCLHAGAMASSGEGEAAQALIASLCRRIAAAAGPWRGLRPDPPTAWREAAEANAEAGAARREIAALREWVAEALDNVGMALGLFDDPDAAPIARDALVGFLTREDVPQAVLAARRELEAERERARAGMAS